MNYLLKKNKKIKNTVNHAIQEKTEIPVILVLYEAVCTIPHTHQCYGVENPAKRDILVLFVPFKDGT